MKASVAVVLLAMAALAACTASRHRDPAQLAGVELYERLCASCHGATAHGDGQVASLIKGGVPVLTRLAQAAGGEFPTERVRRAIDGRWERRAHGLREMPVWGWQLYDSAATDHDAEQARVAAMIDRLIGHLRSVQHP